LCKKKHQEEILTFPLRIVVFEISIFAGACCSHQASFFSRVQMLLGVRYIYLCTRALCFIKQARLQYVQKCFKTLCTLIGCSTAAGINELG